MSKMENFILDRAEADSYPEPRCDLHDNITKEVATMILPIIPEAGTVLDIGCGQGPALEFFTTAGFNVRGITLNREDVSACIAKGFACYYGDQNDLSQFYGLIDLVWARHILEHSIAPFWTLHEFHQVLKPGGILYAEMPAPGTTSCHESNPNHYSVMGEQMWLNLIARAGFDITDARKMEFTTPNGKDHYFGFTCRRK